MTLHIAARDNGETSEIGFYRNQTSQFNRDGILQDGDFKVHESSTPDNNVQIDIGDVVIGIDSPDTDQPDYYYHGWSTAQEAITITSNSSGSERIDIVVAFVDLSVQDDSNSDNPDALKVKAVEGTAGSGAPSESDIQTSVGSGNPWVNLAEITAADGFSSITNSEIADMRPKADTSWRRHDDAHPNFVVSGYSTTQDSGLDGTISAGEAYISDIKVDKPDIAHTFSTSVDTYVDLPKTAKPTNTDDFTYTEVSNGATAPAVASGEMRIAVVVTDGTGITSITTSGEDNNSNKVRQTSPVPSDIADMTASGTATFNGDVDMSSAGTVSYKTDSIGQGPLEAGSVGPTELAGFPRENDTSHTTVTNPKIQSGWGFFQGDDSNNNINETVTFPEAFSSAPIVLVSSLGQAASSPSDIGDFNNVSKVFGQSEDIGASSFSAALLSRDSTNLSSGAYYGYSWIAIGEA